LFLPPSGPVYVDAQIIIARGQEVGAKRPLSVDFRSARILLRVSAQDGKSFLCEMPIMRQDLGDAPAPHRFHRNAVRQTISFVEARFVEAKTVEKRLAGLWLHDYQRIGQSVFHRLNGVFPKDRAMAAVIGQKLAQYFFGGDERYLAEWPHDVNCFGMPLIFWVDYRNPVHGVGK
jgi:hypothetical protein